MCILYVQTCAIHVCMFVCVTLCTQAYKHTHTRTLDSVISYNVPILVGMKPCLCMRGCVCMCITAVLLPLLPLFLQPVDMSASEDDEDEDDGFLSDPPVDAPLDLDHVEIDIGKTPADNIDALAVDNITVELQVDDKESKSQRTIEPLSSSSPIPAKPEMDPTGTAVGNFAAEIMGLFAAKDVDQTSTQEGLAREQPQAPSPEDGKEEDQTDKDVSQRGQSEAVAKSTSSKVYYKRKVMF